MIVSAEKKKDEERKEAIKPQRRGNRVIEDSSSEEEAIIKKLPAASAKAAIEEAGPSSKAEEALLPPHASPASQPPSKQTKSIRPSSAKKPELKHDDVNPAPMDCPQADDEQGAGTQLPQGASSQQQPKGDLILMMLDKLPCNKMLVELNPAPTDAHSKSTMELAGDAGSVGRIVINKNSSGDDAGPSFQIDLKGVLYDAQVLPLNGTAMILNIGVDQAKVECVMHDFIRLKEDPASFTYNNDDGGMNFGSDDDDEGYYAPGEAGGEGGGGEGEEGGKKKPKKVRSLTNPGNSLIERKRPSSAKGTVKKKPRAKSAKAKGASKGKPKAKAVAKKGPATKKRKAEAPKAKTPAAKKKKAGSEDEEEFESEESEDELDDESEYDDEEE